MTSERWQQITSIFHAALACDEAERARVVEARCGEDVDLRREVEAMLGGHGLASAVGNAPAFATPGIFDSASSVTPRVLAPGSRVGAYEVVSLHGAGGMGVVYRARDTKLGREVALKVLLPAVAKDTDRLARFGREARLLALLNDPNIAQVHGFEEDDGVPALVMELVDGPTLAERIAQGALPLDEALAVARQIAAALEAAHEQRIIHRDLKPANIKVRPDGRVKVLDFGLAKLLDSAAPSDVSSASLTDTHAGIVVGTAAYMSPEQGQGRSVDKRTDLWAFGCVVYELLTGSRAFPGETRTSVMSNVLIAEPDWSALPATLPAAIRTLLCRCLEKDPKRRLDSAAIARIEIDDALAIGSHQPYPAVAGRDSPRRRVLGWIAAGLFAALVASAATRSGIWRESQSDEQRMQFMVLPPDNTSFRYAALSPDGRWLTFCGATDGSVQLWVHAVDGTSTRPLPGTDGAMLPFWSPDSRDIGFFAGGKLRRISVSGDVPSTLANVPVPTGGTWSRAGVILFGALGRAGLSQVSASGGEVTTVIRPDLNEQETDYLNPFFLPDGQHFLFNILSGHPARRGVFVGSLDGAPNARLVEENSNAEYAPLPGGGGALLFTREGALLAQRFDPERRRLDGEPVQVIDHVGTTADASTAGVTRRHFTVSSTGVLVFDPANAISSQLAWSDRAGARTVLRGFDNAVMVRLSPDGRRFAVSRLDDRHPGNSDLWIANDDGSNPTRLSFDPANDIFPVWSPDSTRVRWASNRDGVYHVFEKRAEGSGEDRLLFKTPFFKFPTDWSHDGQIIIYRQIDPETGYDIWFAPAEAAEDARPSTPLLQTTAHEAAAVLSPSGRWIAYASDESGRYEVYAQNFPSGGGKRQISTGGGAAPLWRGDGRELYFHTPEGKLMAVTVDHPDTMKTSAPTALFSFRPRGQLITPVLQRDRRWTALPVEHDGGARSRRATVGHRQLARHSIATFVEVRQPPDPSSSIAAQRYNGGGAIAPPLDGVNLSRASASETGSPRACRSCGRGERPSRRHP